MFQRAISLQKFCENALIFVAVYVNVIFFIGGNKKIIGKFNREMASKIGMSDLGKLTYYLRIEVGQYEGGITLNQIRYALRILEEGGMKNCNINHTPIESRMKLSKADDERYIVARVYRRNVGCFRYLLHTRQDLSFAVGVLSRYMQRPK